jgi:hypothetical protein
MTKLPKAHKFFDVSDYGRPAARFIANSLQKSNFTPIHLTLIFSIVGLFAVACIFLEYFWAALFLLILKSVLDAADGELARVKKTPSYTGRYLDSVADILLNLIIIMAIGIITDEHIGLVMLGFLCIQLQGTLYNYYYVILRNNMGGDKTSRIFEESIPLALEGEKQKNVDVLFKIYKILYGGFDKIIFYLDPKASSQKSFPNWFMSLVSVYGLGFQLLIIGVMLVAGWKAFIIPFFIAYSLLIFIFIGIRKLML